MSGKLKLLSWWGQKSLVLLEMLVKQTKLLCFSDTCTKHSWKELLLDLLIEWCKSICAVWYNSLEEVPFTLQRLRQRYKCCLGCLDSSLGQFIHTVYPNINLFSDKLMDYIITTRISQVCSCEKLGLGTRLGTARSVMLAQPTSSNPLAIGQEVIQFAIAETIISIILIPMAEIKYCLNVSSH